jgi:Tol biopolymer transport system component
MLKVVLPSFLLVSFVVLTSFYRGDAVRVSTINDTLHYPEETHFKNVQQLTFGGDNAEAYFSYDGKWLIFQKTAPKEGIPCDQMYIGKIPTQPGETFTPKLVSTGKGRTTCGAFTKDGKHVIYASTHLGSADCPQVPDRSKYGNKYIWPLYDSYDIFMADLNGNIVKQLTNSKGYDAEATLSPDGKKMLYTSTKDGDLELYVMNLKNGKEKRLLVKQLEHFKILLIIQS